MTTILLTIHIAVALVSFIALVAGLVKNTNAATHASLGAFMATILSGVAMVVFTPGGLGRACVSLSVYGIVFALLYGYVSTSRLLQYEK